MEKLSSHHERPHCVVCDVRPTKAISIAGFLLCAECEDRIVHSHPSDSGYDELVSQFRKLWHGLAEAAASRD